MGNRGNIKIKEANGNSIYIYGHWMAYEMPRKLQGALQFAEGRWHDESYCTRCLITEVCKGAWDNTGYGVSTYPTDNDYDVLEVEPEAKTVRLLDKAHFHDETRDWETKHRNVKAQWTFEEYCALPMDGDGDPWDALKLKAVAK